MPTAPISLVKAAASFVFRQAPINMDNAGNLAGSALNNTLGIEIPEGDVVFQRVFFPANAEVDIGASSAGLDGFSFGTFPGLLNGASGLPVLDAQGKPFNFAKIKMVCLLVAPIRPWLQASAGSVLTSDNVNPADGATNTIDAKVYTIKTVLTPAEGEVLRGADADATLLNQIRAINHTGTPGADYSCAAEHPTVSAAASVTDHAFAITALAPGPDANSIVISTTSENLEWSGSVLEGGSEIAQPPVAKPFAGNVACIFTGLLPDSAAEGNDAAFSVDKAFFKCWGGEPWSPDAGASFSIRFDTTAGGGALDVDVNACVTLVIVGDKA